MCTKKSDLNTTIVKVKPGYGRNFSSKSENLNTTIVKVKPLKNRHCG